jgi:hypothetical protein
MALLNSDALFSEEQLITRERINKFQLVNAVLSPAGSAAGGK